VKLQKTILGLVALCASAFMPAIPAHAQQGGAQDSALLDALVKKGVLSDQEAEDITASEEKSYNTTGASKIQMPSSIKTITFYGDLRLRYEMRDGTTGSGPNGAPTAAGVAAFTKGGDSETLNRYRYRLRLGIKGDLYDNFFWGIRAATNPYYDRSGNVNFGASDSAGPFGKARSLMGIDQAFIGWKATSDITLIGGAMPQPLYTTNLVWSDDLSPTGAAEKWDHTFDNGLEVFATAGQFVYGAANGNGISNNLSNTAGTALDASTIFQLAEQIGFKYSFDKDTFFKMAATGYTYTGTNNGGNPTSVAGLYSSSPNVLNGSGANSPSFFNGPFVGAASPFVTNDTGINDLAVIEFPMEFDLKIGPGVHHQTSGDPKDPKSTMTDTEVGWSLPVRFFADFAYNIDAEQRAMQARAGIDSIVGNASAGNKSVTGQGSAAANANLVASPAFQGVLHSGTAVLDQVAYQVGAEFGQLKKKGDWDGKLYWQSTGYYAVDPNLIDSDIFNAATNMEGVVASVAHNWTDGVSSTIRYAYAMPVNGRLATPNVNQDLTLGNIRTYNMFQADVMWKF
jgi:hypothetical protein